MINNKSYRQLQNEYGIDRKKISKFAKEIGINREQSNKNLKLSSLQFDMVLGNVLGDGCIKRQNAGGDCLLDIGHGHKQKEYCQFKFDVLKSFCNIKELSYRERHNDKWQNVYEFWTKCHSEFNQFKDMSVYKQLDMLNANSFIIWMMDDGSVAGQYKNQYQLSGKRFTLDELDYIMETLRNKFGIGSKIHKSRSAKHGHDGLSFRIDESKEVLRVFKESDFYNDVLKTMSYKILDI